jgi:hypothetical protein
LWVAEVFDVLGVRYPDPVARRADFKQMFATK